MALQNAISDMLFVRQRKNMLVWHQYNLLYTYNILLKIKSTVKFY